MNGQNFITVKTEWNGHKMIEIYEANENGEKKSDFAILKMGVKKARAVVEASEDLKNFVDENQVK